MHRQKFTPFLLAGLVSLAAPLTGCEARGTRPPPGEELLQPRVYSVTPAHTEEAWQAIMGALQGGPPGARAERLPDERLLVVAPVELHEKIGAALQKFREGLPVRAAELDYWLVLGEPAGAPAGLDLAPEIAPVLRNIVSSQGPMKFTLLETSRLSSVLDESASAQGDLAHVHQVVSVVAGVPVADITIELRGEHGNKVQQRSLHARVDLRPDQPLLLGQAGYADEGAGGRKTVFYLLRAALTREGEAPAQGLSAKQ